MKAVGIGLIHVYRVVFAWLPSSCRYEPTCSRYAEQAIERAGLKSGNKGFDAAMAAVEMVQVMKQL